MKTAIKHATKSDVLAITSLLNQSAEAMHQQGMSHWLGVYDVDSVSQNLAEKAVYIALDDDAIVGCIALGYSPADYYADCWPDAPKADYYITQLAVLPQYQGQGIGKRLMQFCIEKTAGKSILLDAVDHYPALIRFYQQLGFKIIRTGVGLGDKRHLMVLSQ